MKIEITYPTVEKNKFQRRRLLKILKWPIAAAAIACPIVNIAVGGAAWSVVVLMSMYAVWSLVLSPDLVEYNRISQIIKVTVFSSILLGLINWCLTSGFWAVTVIPIVCFVGLAITGVLFFTDFERQKQNMLPMLLLVVFSIAAASLGLMFWHGSGRWTYIVMGSVAAAILVLCIIILGKEFLKELKKRFHIK